MRRLLILSCSQRKSSDIDLVPALHRYNGPAFMVVRRFIREEPVVAKQLDVYILSAELGIISAQLLIPNYDKTISSQRAVELNESAVSKLSDIFDTGYTEACIIMSKRYLAVLEGWQSFIPSGVAVTVITAAQGLSLTKLKEWLYGKPEATSRKNIKAVKPRGVAHLRGVEIRLTPREIFEQLNLRLIDKHSSASGFKEWYIDIGDRRVSLKWIVSMLTGLPVSSFSTSEARRVLYQLGLTPQHVAGANNGNHSI